MSRDLVQRLRAGLENWGPPHTPTDRMRLDAADRIEQLEQALWEIAGAAGEDLDGDPTPKHLTYPAVEVFAREAVDQVRIDAQPDG